MSNEACGYARRSEAASKTTVAIDAQFPSMVAVIFLPVLRSLSTMAQPSLTSPPSQCNSNSILSSPAGMPLMNSSTSLKLVPASSQNQ